MHTPTFSSPNVLLALTPFIWPIALMPWPRCGTRQPAPRWPLWLISFLTLAFVLILLLLNLAPSERFTSNHLFLDALRPHVSHPTNDPSAGTTEFYQWHTTSSFHPVNFPNAKSLSTDTLCAAFPPAILDSIQPVFKTGHALLGDRVRAHLQTVSACLPELLIFSDADDTFHGHHVIDIIADIPAHLPHVWDHRENQWEPYEQLHALLANGTLDQVDASTLQGWKTDKFKFLPGISRAWRMRPGKEWYVFFEDDTYIMWDSLFRMLGELDPDAPWYLGDPSPGRKPDPDSPKVWFANGGPGYILSRAAMQILVRDDYHPRTGDYLGTRLTEKWWEPETLTNCCGDSILGWVLWNEGVNVSGIWPMISTERPAKIPYTRKYWCKPVVSMHRVIGDEMLDLWHWEWENRKPDVSSRPSLSDYTSLTYPTPSDQFCTATWPCHS